MLGPIIGAVSIEILIEVTRFLNDYQVFLYGVIILVVVLAMPGGIIGVWRDAVNRHRSKMAMRDRDARGGDGKC